MCGCVYVMYDTYYIHTHIYKCILVRIIYVLCVYNAHDDDGPTENKQKQAVERGHIFDEWRPWESGICNTYFLLYNLYISIYKRDEDDIQYHVYYACVPPFVLYIHTQIFIPHRPSHTHTNTYVLYIHVYIEKKYIYTHHSSRRFCTYIDFMCVFRMYLFGRSSSLV